MHADRQAGMQARMRVCMHACTTTVEWDRQRDHSIIARTQASFDHCNNNTVGGMIKARKIELADKLAIANVEKVKPGTLLELGTVAAAMTEVAERVGVPESTILIEPTVAETWARDGIEPHAPNEEDEAFIARVRSSSDLHIIVHSEPPRHYTYCHVELKDERVHKMIFQDSLKNPAESAARRVEKILKNLRLAGESFECPRPSNQAHQRGGWECGLWAARFLERSLRDARNEGRTPPPSIKLQETRLNKFIDQLQRSREEQAAKAAGEAKKAEAKAKAMAKSKARASEVMRKVVQKCKKCIQGLLSLHGQVVRGDPQARRSEVVGE